MAGELELRKQRRDQFKAGWGHQRERGQRFTWPARVLKQYREIVGKSRPAGGACTQTNIDACRIGDRAVAERSRDRRIFRICGYQKGAHRVDLAEVAGIVVSRRATELRKAFGYQPGCRVERYRCCAQSYDGSGGLSGNE